MTVGYEWDCETVEDESADVLDHRHGDTYREVLAYAKHTPEPGQSYRIVLVRDDDEGRSWAYLEDGKLPEKFTDAYDHPTAKVPLRYHREVERQRLGL